MFDSGATRTMINSVLKLSGPLERKAGTVRVAGGGGIPSTGTGLAGNLGKALVVPDLDLDLISTPQDDLSGYWTVFGGEEVVVMDERPILKGNVIRSGELVNNKYLLEERQFKDLFRGAHYVHAEYLEEERTISEGEGVSINGEGVSAGRARSHSAHSDYDHSAHSTDILIRKWFLQWGKKIERGRGLELVYSTTQNIVLI
jgi:hypothetical protein